ncbi:MAG: hypothetical protein Q4F21_05800 [Lachnospiraceae bacterium]|nr:hypothetical protein [Lachnospiraceae bacterium]
MKQHHFSAAIAAIFCVILAGSISVAAAVHFLSPKDVATKQGDTQLASAFENQAQLLQEERLTEYESQECGNYQVTFLGMISGKNISSFAAFENEKIIEDSTYAVTAVKRKDGTPIPDKASEWEHGFYQSFLIGGLNPAQSRMGDNSSGCVKDGTAYFILQSENIEMFADRNVYLAVYEDAGKISEAYQFNENAGTIERNDSYNDLNALFQVPLDASKADPEKAEEYLNKQAEKTSGKHQTALVSAEELTSEEGRIGLTKRGKLAAKTPCQVCTNENGETYVEFAYELENDSYSKGRPEGVKRAFDSNWKASSDGTWFFMGYYEAEGDEGTVGYAELIRKEKNRLNLYVYRIEE